MIIWQAWFLLQTIIRQNLLWIYFIVLVNNKTMYWINTDNSLIFSSLQVTIKISKCEDLAKCSSIYHSSFFTEFYVSSCEKNCFNNFNPFFNFRKTNFSTFEWCQSIIRQTNNDWVNLFWNKMVDCFESIF